MMSIPLSADGLSATSKHLLAIPMCPDLLEALGQLAVTHTHLELILRYTVKTLSGLTIVEALDATNGDRTSDVRSRIRRLFKEKKPTEVELSRIDSLLGKAQRLSSKRNDYLHSAWSISPAGQLVMKGEDYSWGLAPTTDDILSVASEILALSKQLNDARVGGFIHDLVARQPPSISPSVSSPGTTASP